jgi:microcystin-dependent protein
MTFYKWSQAASADATADSTINWAEGQSPSSVNDSARAMMAATAKYRDDIAGAIVTGGTSTAYTVASYQVFDTLAHMNGAMIAFSPHVTNGATVTLNVDGLGALPLRGSPNFELLAGTLIAGTPYAVTYNNFGGGCFYLHGFFGNPYNTPLGGAIMYFGSTAPNSSFVFPYGQAISRTTYATLFSLVSTIYGAGDSSTTFNVPDLRGRIPAGKDDMGGSAASRLTPTYFGTSAAALGAVGGGESHTLSLGELPTGITTSGSNSISVNSTSSTVHSAGTSDNYTSVAGTGTFNSPTRGTITSTGSNTVTATSNNTSGSAHTVVQPTIICNYIMRII